MVRYFKNVSGVPVEAPFEISKDGKTIRGYNKPSNETMLLADGYVKYTGTKDMLHLKFENDALVELEEVPIMQTVFTKLQIRRAMRKMGIEDKLDAALSGNVEFQKDWNDAQEIDLNDYVFRTALSYYNLEEDFINSVLDNIEE
jgi:hypothetical protein